MTIDPTSWTLLGLGVFVIIAIAAMSAWVSGYYSGWQTGFRKCNDLHDAAKNEKPFGE